MPDAAFFSTLGFFTVPRFLDAETCARVHTAVQAAPARHATVVEEDKATDVDRATRSTELAGVSPETSALVESRLRSVMGEVARHYDVPLSGWQKPQFLVYREGDFFRVHRDREKDKDVPDFVDARRIAAVIFLNDDEGAPEAGSYRGGSLTLYGIFDQPGSESVGVPVKPERGLLMTFPAEVLHEVTRVESGERYTVVTWFVA